MIAPTLKTEIISRIRRGVYPPGSRLPKRIELTNEFKVSRGTIDKVMTELRKEGYIKSSRGDGTYVLADWAKEQKQIFMVLPDNYYLDRSLNGPWVKFLNSHCGKIPHTVSHTRELESLKDLICTSDSRLIWVCPPGSSLPIIEKFRNLGVRQILIARTHAQVSYVNTDTLGGLRKMLSWLQNKHGNKVSIGMLLNCIDMEKPYRIERELYFNQVAGEMNLRISRVVRAENDKESSLQNAVSRYFKGKIPKALFISDVIFNRYVEMTAKAKGLKMGKDLIVISCADRILPEGGAAMGIPWKELYDEAIKWAISDKNNRISKLIEPPVFTDIKIEELASDSELKAMWDYIGDIINK